MHTAVRVVVLLVAACHGIAEVGRHADRVESVVERRRGARAGGGHEFDADHFIAAEAADLHGAERLHHLLEHCLHVAVARLRRELRPRSADAELFLGDRRPQLRLEQALLDLMQDDEAEQGDDDRGHDESGAYDSYLDRPTPASRQPAQDSTTTATEPTWNESEVRSAPRDRWGSYRAVKVSRRHEPRPSALVTRGQPCSRRHAQ